MKATRVYPPGPKNRFPLENLFRLRRDRIGSLQEMVRTYGDIVYFKVGGDEFFVINRPDLIQGVLVTHHRSFIKSRGLQVTRRTLGNGLLTSEGDFHLRQRRLVQPAFHRQRLSAYGQVMAGYAARLSDRWQDGARVDMAHEMMELTLAIVGKTLFDADVEKEAGEIGQALTETLHGFNRALLPLGGLLEKLPLPSNRRIQEARARLDATVYRMIAERRAGGEDKGDLLSMLLMAQDEEGDGGVMTDKQVRDEAMTLFLAGHETTALALTWTWWLLAQNPPAEARLHEELERVLGGRTPQVEDAAALTYTRMVLAEAMRLYPPAYAMGRQAIEDYFLDEYLAPAGSTVLMSQYVMHRNPRYYPDPERFDPLRWTPEAQAERPKFAYFPFGGGPRICIGESFAWLEGILVMAELAQHWRPRLVSGHQVTLNPLVTLRPKGGIPMTLERHSPG